MKLNPMTGGGFGPNPWLQTSWDWRAAGNFICGGMGSGLLIATALFGTSAPHSLASPHWQVFAGLALVGLGLLCVWLEIGRPLRALHVFLNPRTSWMSREAFVGALLFPAGLAAMLGLSGWIWVTAALAMAFLYCQSRMLPAARGIPAWRSGVLSLLMVVTGWCEGCGLFMLLGDASGRSSRVLVFVTVGLLVVRLLVWQRHCRDVDETLAARAREVLKSISSQLRVAGTLIPVGVLVAGWLIGLPVQGFAAAFLVWTGANTKYLLITRASYNQGFALTKLPVRGVRT
jgi:phenylacetyl-CoA:acceptor oxidoreductase subunit 2